MSRPSKVVASSKETLLGHGFSARVSVQFYRCPDEKLLVARFRRFIMPNAARTDMTTISMEPYSAKKVYNSVFPSPAQILDNIRAKQDDPLKFKNSRKGSMGASTAAIPVGYSKYMDNWSMFKQETGAVMVYPSGEYTDYENFDHGHYVEAEGADMYQLLMGCDVYKAGTFLHWKFPWLHVSPDRCAIFPTGVVHNIYAINDSRRGGVELKSPWELYTITLPSGVRLMILPAEYMIQVQLQMRNQCWDWIDFAVHKKPRLQLEQDKFGGVKELSPGRYLVSETTICRVYRNNAFVDALPRHISAYINSVRTNKIPSIRRAAVIAGSQVALPACVQLPLKWTQNILTTPADEQKIPLKEGVLNGTIEVHTLDYTNSPPLSVPISVMMNAKKSKGENIEVLSEVPPVGPNPTLDEVMNPLYRELMQADPSKSLADIIWDLTLDNYHYHYDEGDLTKCPTDDRACATDLQHEGASMMSDSSA